MSVETVKNVPLAEVPDLNCGVSGSGQKVSAVGVEGDLIHGVVVGIVVLDESLASNIPDFDGLVVGARCDASAIGVESDGVDTVVVVLEGVDECLGGDIPELDGPVFGGRCDQSGVGGELSGHHPVRVRVYTEHEFAVLQLEHLEGLVVTTGE